MLDAAARFLDALSLPPDTRILVGFSGGADSCALLHFLASYLGSQQLVALHVNHGIRGDEALRDEAFAKAFAASLQVAFFCHRADVPALVKATGDSPENAAREARYQAYQRYAASQACSYIALAHHEDDFAETFFLNLARGSGARGLSGMPALRAIGSATLIRPFLGLRRTEIEAYCSHYQLPFVTDSSNLTDFYARNKLRHHVLPIMQEINPSFTRKLREAADALAADDAYLTKMAQKEYHSRLSGNALLASDLFSLPSPIAVRILKLFLADRSIPFNRDILSGVQSLFEAGRSPSGRLSVADGVFLARSYDHLVPVFTELPPLDPLEIDLSCDGIYPLTGELTLFVTHRPFPGPAFSTPSTIYIRPQSGPALIRSRKPGDEWIGPNGKKSLKRLFIDRKIPKSERERIPVIEAGGRIICVYLLGPSYPEWVDGVGQEAICLDFVKNMEDI